ncbi:MAG: hypothetical protein LBT00_13025 [Spirochaetaceae bacterium]|nr:hypothetical protein [Spirochaetaceae bacterium]
MASIAYRIVFYLRGQSYRNTREGRPRLDCVIANGLPVIASEAKQSRGLSRLDCFTLRVRNDGHAMRLAMTTLPLRGIENEPLPPMSSQAVNLRLLT